MRRLLTLAQAGAAALVLARLARGRHRRPPLAPGGPAPAGSISVVIPARDEADRIGPCLEGVLADPDAAEVLVVVDHGTTDATAEIARAAGARVLEGAPLPDGWVGKPWVLQQGLEAATGDIVVALDADTRPRPGLLRALGARLDGADLVSAGARFSCDTAGERLLHPAMLATLVYRFGPTGVDQPRVSRTVANGQCIAVRRSELLAAGGFAIAREHMNDDIALVRALAMDGRRIAFEDGADLIGVRMHASAGEVWREWGRSLAMQDTTAPRALALDLAVVWLVLALPVTRLLARRTTRLDRALLGLRVAMLAALARAYEKRGPAFWLSPLADPAAALCLTLAVARPRRTWRGRTYRPPSERIPRTRIAGR
jgi:dolichol-phosphate mannosyltransferase